MSFDQLGLSAELLRAVVHQGYSSATPIQQQSIPLVLAKRDLLACAQTGTGKTAGFTLPLLQRLNDEPKPSRHVRALILTPTRELAAQVHESVRNYGRHLKLRSTEIYGGVSERPQIAELRRGVDIVIATPGRLLDLLGQRAVDLSRVEILVLDEADRMLDMGFIRDIRRILSTLPRQRQNLMFSATFSDEIRRLAQDFLVNPAEVQVAPRNSTVERVSQVVHPVEQRQKRALLSHLIGGGDWRQVLVFTRTKHGANRLAAQLSEDGIDAAAIHGNKSQGARRKALSSFRAGNVRVLVATDIAARGLDIERLPHVVNYELPNVPEDYVHRIGRTARAGQAGNALSLVSRDEQPLLRGIEKLLNTRLPQEVVKDFVPGPAAVAATPAESRGKRSGGAANGQRRPGNGNGRRRRRSSRRQAV